LSLNPQFNNSTITQSNNSTIQQLHNPTIKQLHNPQFNNPQFNNSTIPQSSIKQFHNPQSTIHNPLFCFDNAISLILLPFGKEVTQIFSVQNRNTRELPLGCSAGYG